MKKWRLIIDVEKCEDCNNCFLACKDEHVDNDWPGYSLSQPRHGHRWINIMRRERGSYPHVDAAYRPTTCMHCDDAPCIKASKGAAYKRDDGIVIFDPIKSKGRKELVNSCPYQAIWWNEEREVPQKCTLCAHLLDEGWKVPRCVQVCPTGALRVEYVEDDEMSRIAQKEELEPLHPEYKTLPSVLYKNMYRFNKCFIAGSVAIERNGVVDCAEGAEVTLFKEDKKLDQVITDNFGDFKFDRLEENSGAYILEVKLKSGEKKILEVEVGTSVNAGIILF